MHLVRVLWKLENEKYIHGILVWKEGNSALELVELTPGSEIKWTISGPKYCIGRRLSETDFVRCPSNQVVTRTQRKCNACSDFDYFDLCIRCTGASCEATPARNQVCMNTPAVVYAAVFNDRTLKVGVSYHRRVMIRWLEQGADYAAVIATLPNGINARQLESQLGKLTGVTKSVSNIRKQANLLNHISLAHARELIDPIFEKTTKYHSSVEITDLSSYYGLSSLDMNPHTWIKRNQPIEELRIAGTIVGMKGSLLVTRINSSFHVIDLNTIVGYDIEANSNVNITTQSGLEDYL